MFRRRMNGYEDLLFGGLPAALASIGAGDSVLAYLDVVERGSEDELLDALAEVSDQAFAIAALARGPGEASLADRAERIASLAHHLMMHESLLLGAPRRSALHHDRAIVLAAELGILTTASGHAYDA